ncbi:NTP transferase domain-containing protein [Methylobacterium oxalidis]|uniref:NTP transferase domain-containing protein n=1 Tax=Methylobacterium oxalidis TaxID=944322 RepID=UPI00331506B1
MAGFSRRFTQAGYALPKYELPVAGRPALDWSLLSFSRSFGKESLILIFRDLPGVPAFVEERLKACEVPDAKLIPLPAPTEGQAETVAAGLERAGVPGTEPVTVFNIDTFRPGLELPPSPALAACDGYLETFLGEGDHWSFIEPSCPPCGRVKRVAEKERISSYCCTGLYHFASAALYDRAYRQERAKRSSCELFVAPLYQHMIESGADIRFSLIESTDVFFCGTPTEYENLRERELDLRRAFAR